jgi:hypothetical protein
LADLELFTQLVILIVVVSRHWLFVASLDAMRNPWLIKSQRRPSCRPTALGATLSQDAGQISGFAYHRVDGYMNAIFHDTAVPEEWQGFIQKNRELSGL